MEFAYRVTLALHLVELICIGRHCDVFFGKRLDSHTTSLDPGVFMGTGEFNAKGVAGRGGGRLTLNGLVHHRVTPTLNLAEPIYTSGWREALWELSVLQKNTAQWPGPVLKSTVTIKSPCQPLQWLNINTVMHSFCFTTSTCQICLPS